ncbi:hypothetical protein GUJ93_ZPchr0012g21101 [Zizania palustris]|uniref:Calmodulin-binding protein n=1 Tax=Zizania palustris TaxID=103762 RepID=A0A8J5WQQ9_ZIZPA|nr:hypothetical protein GUJ93_ZPchr0012g21101 [Zizania palustris]
MEHSQFVHGAFLELPTFSFVSVPRLYLPVIPPSHASPALLSSPMAPSKRLLPWSDDAGGGGGGELSRPRKRWRSVVLRVRGRRSTMEGVFGFRELMPMFLPFFGRMVQRVVSEEVDKAFFRRFSIPTHAPPPPRLLVGWNQRPRYQLMFQNGLKPVYTMLKLQAKDGPTLKVAIVERLENNQMSFVKFGHLSSAKVEIVVLHGNFNANNEEQWSPEDFNKHIVRGREKSAQLLTGNLTLKLSGGEAFLENATFTDNSSFTSTKKFRLGLRLVNASEDRVLEGITEPFRVKERRVEGYEKHYPPMLDDEVWRLENIRRNGAYHQALSNSGVDTVQKLLQSYATNEKKLMQNFSKMSQAAWKAIISHAMTCEVSNNLCLYEAKDSNIRLFFNAIHQLVGVKFGNSYKSINELSQIEKNVVETMKHVAYENMSGVQFDHKMVNNYPEPFQGVDTSMLTNFVPNHQVPNCGQYNSSLAEFSSDQAFELGENISSFQGAPNQASVDRSRFFQGQTSNSMQFSCPLVMDEVIPDNSIKESLLPGPRVMPLCIPNTEIDFGPHITASAAHGNIQTDHFATQFGQYRHNELSHSTEELYNLFSQDNLLPTNEVMTLMQPHLWLPRNSENFGNQTNLVCNDQTSEQIADRFQRSRTNSFNSSSCHQLVENFKSQIFSSGGTAMPLSPRKWIKIKAALKLAAVGRFSRASHRPPTRPMLVPTI